VLDMLGLGRIEVIEELPGFRRVMTVASKIVDPFFLLGNTPRSFYNMPLGLFQMTKLDFSVHGQTPNGSGYVGDRQRVSCGSARHNASNSAFPG
jgi:hypothetical protein